MVRTYTRKPYEVEAVQWTGDNIDEIKKFVNKPCDVHRYIDPELTPKIFIDMLDDVIVVNGGDYIYRTDKCDGFYISKAEVFEENFYIDSSRD